MDKVNVVEVLFISLNRNIPLIGKLWLTVFLFFRVFILLFAGFPLFWDEGERFMCNTIHPSCTNICFDAFAPLSLCRFGFLHLVCVCLPTALYMMHHTQRVLTALTRQYFVQEHHLQIPTPGGSKHTDDRVPGGGPMGLYLLQLILRVFLEVAFGAGQYFLFGVSVRREFLCLQASCSPAVECFTSRPTEKTFLLQWMLANAVLSVILSTAELSLVLRDSVQEKRDRNRLSLEGKEEEEGDEGARKRGEIEKNYFNCNGSSSAPLPFRKRKPNEDPTLTPWVAPKWSNAGHIPLHLSSCAPAPDGGFGKEDSRAVLCSAGTIKLWNGHCRENGSMTTLLPSMLTSNTEKLEEWNPNPARPWRAGQYTPATTNTEHTSDSGESQDNKAWV
ncbi:gap junction Cx32.2 protein-like [Salminus brasiliensis]|uniref:gap junction Cx32.2 protein-like n=1 Tax=Salminus brasiliensis TaxID=930266 RepID=UPI003B832F00